MIHLSLRSMLMAMLLIGSLSGCGQEEKKEVPPEPNLKGTWHPAMPAGFKFEVGSDYRGAALTR